MTRDELIEKVEAQIVAMKLEQGTQQPQGYLVMSIETLALLFNMVYGELFPSYKGWKGVMIHPRKEMAFGEVEAVSTHGEGAFSAYTTGGHPIVVDKHAKADTIYTTKMTTLTKDK